MEDGWSQQLTPDRQKSHLPGPLPLHDKRALTVAQQPSSPLALTGSDISIDPASIPLAILSCALFSYPNCGTDVFFVIACLLTGWEGCDQTGELHVRRQCLWCLVLCPRGMRVKVICDWARGLATLRGSGEGPVVSGAAPLGGFRTMPLYFNLS